MPQCLHPIQIPHPTFKKWRNSMLQNNHIPTAVEIDRFLKTHGLETTSMKVPCGKCLYCYQRKQEFWRVRLQQEKKASFVSFFVTLTYADDHVPKDGVSKRDFQKFLKRFRQNMAIPLRYFCISEYGPHSTHRPHYHFALFFEDYVSFEETFLELEKSWHSIVNIKPLDDGQIHYLSTYCLKFFQYNPIGKNPNFMLCSRRPFIGFGFLSSEMCDNLRKKLVPYLSVNGFKKPIPQIYKAKIFDDAMVIEMREKQNEFQKRKREKNIESYGSESLYEEAMRYKEKLDYNTAWRKFKESKKL